MRWFDNSDSPWTEFAKNLTPEERRKHDFGRLWGNWRLWVSYIGLTLVYTYFPWSRVANWPAMQVLADFMAALLPVIDGLQSELRHRPFEVSRVYLAAVHATGMLFAFWRVATQRRLAAREMSAFESVMRGTAFSLMLLFFLYHTFNHVGYAEGGRVYALHQKPIGATFIHGVHWIVIAASASFVKAFYQEAWYQSREW
jgi:hypothetical protein